MKITLPWRANRPHRTPESSPIPRAYQPWMLASLVILVGSLLVLVVVGTIAFVYYANVLTPIGLTILGALAAFGVVLGFAGFFILLAVAAYTSFKGEKGGSVGLQPHESTRTNEGL